MNDDLDFDLIDDLVHFINNDPDFYKQQFYPVVQKFVNGFKYNLPLTKTLFVPVVKDAYQIYRKKFDLHTLPDQLDTHDLSDICGRLYDQEMAEVEKETKNTDEETVSEDIAQLKKLAGITNSFYSPYSLTEMVDSSSAKSEYMKQNSILPGTNEWFKLLFSRDGLSSISSFRGRIK